LQIHSNFVLYSLKISFKIKHADFRSYRDTANGKS
jgi:hypothetical protein